MKGYQLAKSFMTVPFSRYIDVAILSAGKAKQVDIPPKYTSVIINGTGNVWHKVGDNPTATIPSSDITDGSGSGLNPGERSINGEAKLSLISDTNCMVSLEYYK